MKLETVIDSGMGYRLLPALAFADAVQSTNAPSMDSIVRISQAPAWRPSEEAEANGIDCGTSAARVGSNSGDIDRYGTLPHSPTTVRLQRMLELHSSRGDHPPSAEEATRGEGEEGGDDDDVIPYDYEAELEACSQYTFSSAPYSPSATANLVMMPTTAGMLNSSPPSDPALPYTPRFSSLAASPRHQTTPPDSELLHPLRWRQLQSRDTGSYAASEPFPRQRSTTERFAMREPANIRYALLSLIREARCRDLQALRSLPASAFVHMERPQADPFSCSSMRASCLLASAKSPTQRKLRYMRIILEQWKALEARLEEIIAEAEAMPPADRGWRLESLSSTLRNLYLFSSNPKEIVREMNAGYAEEQRRQRRDRGVHVLATLEAQGRLFLLPTLYAEESEDPVPVLRIEAVLTPDEVIEDGVPLWQLNSPDISVSSSLSASMQDDSVGTLSPNSSHYLSTSCSSVVAALTAVTEAGGFANGGGVEREDEPAPAIILLDIFKPGTPEVACPMREPARALVAPFAELSEVPSPLLLGACGISSTVLDLSCFSLPFASAKRVCGSYHQAAKDGLHAPSIADDEEEESWGFCVEDGVIGNAGQRESDPVDFFWHAFATD